MNEAFQAGFGAALESAPDLEDALLAGFVDELEKFAFYRGGRLSTLNRMQRVAEAATKRRGGRQSENIESIVRKASARGFSRENPSMRAFSREPEMRSLLAKKKRDIVGGKQFRGGAGATGAAAAAAPPKGDDTQSALEQWRSGIKDPRDWAKREQRLAAVQKGREARVGAEQKRLKGLARLKRGPGAPTAAGPAGAPEGGGPAAEASQGKNDDFMSRIRRAAQAFMGKESAEAPATFDEFLEKSAAKKWIQKAIKKPGALHKQLGVPQGKKIPTSTIEAASEAPGKLGKRARLAQTLKKLRK